ncbi:MAG: osmotically inducible protein C, partial [Sphingopyxis sp.]|nr:osmotically inducible protein C [Sphingopyxis sp.]
TGAGKFQVAISAGGTMFLADEPVSVGGLGSGPSPFDLLSAALAACTTMTLRLYADGKKWPVTRIRTAVGHQKEVSDPLPDLFNLRIAVEGDLDAEQQARLLEIAERCPVHRTLERGARFSMAAGEPPAPCEQPEAHMEAMERSTSG